MARALHTRLIFAGTLTATTPLHIGSAGDGVEVDMPVALNGIGQPYAPGTSLAGAIRAWMEAMVDPSLVRCWFGYQDPITAAGSASRLVVEDAFITLPDEAPKEVWHGVGIDRQWGSAVAGFKFERQVLPKGSSFSLCLHLDVVDAEELDEARAALWLLAQALINGRIGIGAANTRGLGRITLNDGWHAWEQNWSSKAGVLAIMAAGAFENDTRATWQAAANKVGWEEPKAITITIDWSPNGPLMVKAPHDGLAVDTLPMLSADGTFQTMVLPGSGIKGVLRSHAERIVRTLCGHEFEWLTNNKNRFAQQLTTVPLVTEIFGSALPPKNGPKGTKGLRGALYVDPSYATNIRMEPKKWRDITDARGLDEGQQSPLPEFFTKHGLKFQHGYHVALDRWTGGAADGLLYSGIEPMGVEWQPLHLRLDIDPLKQRNTPLGVAFALLWLVLRDLSDGGLGLGFGVNRGYGNVTVRSISITGLDDIDPAFPNETKISCDHGELDQTQIAAGMRQVAEQWEAWVQGMTSCMKLMQREVANVMEDEE